MEYPEIEYPREKALELHQFREMDYFAVNNYNLPVELMMENAGLQLANLVSLYAKKDSLIKVGIGNGNNGGGGLVAARRLAAWGYLVYLDIFTDITNDLVRSQLTRALKFGAIKEDIQSPDIWIDAYLGFSQKLPLQNPLLKTIENANNSSALKVSLDIPTGFLSSTDVPFFHADKILTLAAPKKNLYNLNTNIEIFVADLGIPIEVYQKFGINNIPFQNHNIVRLKR